MSTPRIVHAQTLQARIEAALTELPGIVVTFDPLDIPSGSRQGVVVIAPPDLTFPTYAITEISHELAVIAGPPTDVPQAWSRLDAIIEALRVAGLPIAAARGDMFAVKTGPSLPGYVVTLNPETVIDESETP